MELYGPDPNSFNSEVFNASYFQFLTQPVSYETLRNTAVTNIAGTTSYIQSKEVNLAGVVVQQGNLEVNQDIIGNSGTTITAGIAQIPNITTVSDNLIIQASSPNNIYLGYDDGEGNLFINTNTQSNLYVDGGDLVMNNVNQKLVMGTASLHFNETNSWSAAELKADVISVNGINLETKLTTVSNDIIQNKQDADSHFQLVESVAAANKTALETSLNSVNTSLTANIDSVNTTLSQQISSNQTQNDNRFTAVDATAESNKTLLQTSISTLDTNLTSSINSLNTALTQTINQNKSESDTRFLSVEQTALSNKTALEQSISSVNSSLTSSINSTNSTLTQTINLNKSDADSRMTTIESTASSNKSELQASISTLDSAINTKVDANKALMDASFNNLAQTKADISFVETKVAQLVNNAPELLNSLSELSAAIANDNNFSTSITNLIGTKVSQTDYNSQVATLQSSIGTKASSDFVTTELDKKVANTDYAAYQSQVASALDSKVAVADYNSQVASLQSSIDTKASTANVANNVANLQGQIDTKASSTDLSAVSTNLQSQIDTKSSLTFVEGQLTLKADKSELQSATSTLQSSIDTKASTSYVDGQFSLKADKTELQSATSSLQSSIDTKASTSYLDGQLALKTDKTELQSAAATLQSNIDAKSSTAYVNEQLLTKVSVSDAQTTTNNLTSLINEKSSIVYVDGQFALKANKSYVDDQLSTVSSQLALKADTNYVDTKINDVVGAAPSTLDTLQEIASAIAEDANFSVTIINQIATKSSKTYVDGEVASLQSQINDRPLTSYVNQQLDLKGDTTYINAQLALKSNAADVTTALAAKANASDLSSLTTVVSSKADTSYVNSKIVEAKSYADSAVSSATTGLATQVYVDNKTQMVKDDILGGASTAYDTLLELQTALLDNGDAVAALTNQIATKSSITYVDNAVANLQANLQTDINTKASITYVDSQIAAIPPPVSLTGYATESYVNTAIQNVNGADLTNYATKSYVDTAITDLSGNYASQSYVDTAIAAIPVPDLSSYATSSSVTTAVANVKSEILGGATAAFDTLSELNALIQSGDSSVSSALTSQIALKANDNAVVHLTGTETIGGIKTFSNNVTVPSLNNISSTTLGYLSGTTSSIQTQLNAKANSNAVVDLTNTQTIAGVKTFTSNVVVPSLNSISSTTIGYLLNVTSDIQAQLNSKATASGGTFLDTTSAQTITSAATKEWQNLNIFSRIREPMITLNNVGDISDWDITLGHLAFLTPVSANPMRIYMLNVPLVAGTTYTVSAIINTSTNKQYVNVMRVNGTGYTLRFSGGAANINISSAIYVVQTFTIVILPGASLPSTILSSVSPWF